MERHGSHPADGGLAAIAEKQWKIRTDGEQVAGA